jgi:hypothetical protein
MTRRVLLGIVWGTSFASLYSAYVVVVATVSGSPAFAKDGVTLQGVVLTYFAGGVVAGAIVGVLLPLRRSFIGAIVIGIAAALPVIAGILFTMLGMPRAGI